MSTQHAEEALPAQGIPNWSGIPTFLGRDKDLAIVPMHVSDQRALRLVGYQHVDLFESLDGEVEYHVHIRIRIPVPRVSESKPDQGTPHVW
jgi:hypothetical protein